MKNVYVDGGCFPNPGKKYVAVVIDNEYVIRHTGEGTNNEAEYEAVYYGLLEAYLKGYSEVAVITDSLLVYNQITGKWSYDPKFEKYINNINELKKKFRSASILWIRRDYNPAHPILEEYIKNIFKSVNNIHKL